YAEFEERLGHPSGYKPQGYLFLANSESHLEYLRTNQDRQKALGLKSARMVSTDDIRKLFPQLRSDDVLGGSFCSTDGFVDPYSVMTGFMMRAIDGGARLFRNTEVTGIEIDSQGVRGVKTNNGSIATRNVVNAAGAWSAQVANL